MSDPITDQEQFDEAVNTKGKLFLQIAGGVGIFAAVIMSLAAIVISTSHQTTVKTMMQAAARPAGPTTATVMIQHVTKGCHVFAVAGGTTGSPTATVHLAAGGTLHLQNNDVMPHQLMLATGSATGATITEPTMSRMGAKSDVTFTAPGTYVFKTKPGEDYMKGIVTTGDDNVLRLNVVVNGSAA